MAKINAKPYTAGKKKDKRRTADEDSQIKTLIDAGKSGKAGPWGKAIAEIADKSSEEAVTDKYRWLKQFALIAIVFVVLITACVTFFTFAGFVGPLTPIIAVAGSTEDTSGGKSRVDFGVKAQDFYGVRVFYENDNTAQKELITIYNAFVCEMLQLVGQDSSVSTSKFNNTASDGILPENFYEIYKAEEADEAEETEEAEEDEKNKQLTIEANILIKNIIQEIIFEMYKTSVQKQIDAGAELEPVPADAVFEEAKLKEYLNTIDHFGLTKEEFDLVKTTAQEKFIQLIEEDLAKPETNQQKYLTLASGKTLEDINFDTIFTNVKFNNFKTVSDKLFVKDLILKEEDSTEKVDMLINGNAVYYIYMPRKTLQMSGNTYKCKIENESSWKVNIGYFDIAEDEVLFISTDPKHEIIVDKSYFDVVNSEHISTGDKKVYKKIIEVSDLNSFGTFNAFEAINQENLKELNKENLSLFKLGNLSNAEMYSSKTPVEDGFNVLSYLPTQKCLAITFTPENIVNQDDTFLFGEFGVCAYAVQNN